MVSEYISKLLAWHLLQLLCLTLLLLMFTRESLFFSLLSSSVLLDLLRGFLISLWLTTVSSSGWSLVLSANSSAAAFALKIKDEIANLIFDSKSVLPTALLVLTGVITTAFLKTVFNTVSKVAYTFFNITDHALVTLLLVLDLDTFLLKSFGRIVILIAYINLLSGQCRGSLLHHGLGSGLKTIGLGNSATRSSSYDRSTAARMSLGILDTEQLQSGLHDGLLSPSHL
ncbi:hypothetical protein HG530_003050 [Fusarium avenaceum]|nr:hypothetical protein HG530_003050 [Fusarium avenaceum]